jgi:hypothetical protein
MKAKGQTPAYECKPPPESVSGLLKPVSPGGYNKLSIERASVRIMATVKIPRRFIEKTGNKEEKQDEKSPVSF